ncbi:unnamed protein product [Thelazia callipaeda]|uniref:Cobalamin biosynthesis protein CbiM n=1 Tax=Thelazia callipaeda TaxID=103827 RepID=A0A0N5CX58_THECL|nr:unnamed protein product [Thelazia callipaeda]
MFCKNVRNLFIASLLITICFPRISCAELLEQRVEHVQVALVVPESDIDGWTGDSDNCDSVANGAWSQYLLFGMVFGFMTGVVGGILGGFLCWQIRVYKEETISV